MGEIADDMVNGRCCQWCGIYFIEEHGYPVLCNDCWSDCDEKEEFNQATLKEL